MIKSLMSIAAEAGKKILDIYQHSQNIKVITKADKTPLTEADIAAHNHINCELKKLTPKLPVLSEEAADIIFEKRKCWERYWLIDPLDGTKEFLHRTDEFTVNIALIEDHNPVIGIIYAPVTNTYYFAEKSFGAYKQIGAHEPSKISTRLWQKNKNVVTVSRRHAPHKLRGIENVVGDYRIEHVGSALKFGLVAEGIADIYPRFGPTSEWDTAAGQCIVNEAGGAVLDLNLQPLQYNLKDSLLNPNFLVVADPTYANLWLKAFENTA